MSKWILAEPQPTSSPRYIRKLCGERKMMLLWKLRADFRYTNLLDCL